MPDRDLRHEYFTRAFPAAGKACIERLAGSTEGWSFAYLNELRTTAVLRSLGDGSDAPGAKEIDRSYELLADQFHAGRKNHAGHDESPLGFRAA